MQKFKPNGRIGQSGTRFKDQNPRLEPERYTDRAKEIVNKANRT